MKKSELEDKQVKRKPTNKSVVDKDDDDDLEV